MSIRLCYTTKGWHFFILNVEQIKKGRACQVYFQDTLSGVRKLADFLEVEYSDELLQKISEMCQFEHMKERYTEKMLGPTMYKPEIKYGFMRKGKTAVHIYHFYGHVAGYFNI